MTHTQPQLEKIAHYAGLLRIKGNGPEVSQAWREVAAELERLDAMVLASLDGSPSPSGTWRTPEENIEIDKAWAMIEAKIPEEKAP